MEKRATEAELKIAKLEAQLEAARFQAEKDVAVAEERAMAAEQRANAAELMHKSNAELMRKVSVFPTDRVLAHIDGWVNEYTTLLGVSDRSICPVPTLHPSRQGNGGDAIQYEQPVRKDSRVDLNDYYHHE